jgi:hypothetical protein
MLKFRHHCFNHIDLLLSEVIIPSVIRLLCCDCSFYSTCVSVMPTFNAVRNVKCIL